MIAIDAAKTVARFIEKSWPRNRKDIFDIIKLACNHAWQEGKWLGMTAEMHVPVYTDSAGQKYIIAPQSHPVLLAMNIIGQQHLIARDKFFMFHRNGYGDIRNGDGCNWNRDVYDLGEQPYINRNNIIISNGIRIGVRSLGSYGPNEKVWISGNFKDDSKIFTYKNSEYGSCCGCSGEQVNGTDTINGIEIPIGEGFTYINNICFSEIEAIHKTVTRSPIEIIALTDSGNGHLISRMDPGMKKSRYRKYLIPNQLCGRTSVHCIFKIGKQEDITSDSDNIIIDSETALISLAMGVYSMYHKENQEAGASYILQGLSSLSKEKQESESAQEFPIQVERMYDGDLTSTLERFS